MRTLNLSPVLRLCVRHYIFCGFSLLNEWHVRNGYLPQETANSQDLWDRWSLTMELLMSCCPYPHQL